MNNNKLKFLYIKTVPAVILFGVLVFIIFSCDNEYYPKPRGYFRIDMPEKSYIKFDTTFPYSFEYPVYAKIVPDEKHSSDPYWLNIEYPQFKGTLYLSYKTVSDNLATYIEDTRKMVMKHIPKTSGIENRVYENPENKVYGLTYSIGGTEAASPYQFYVTDSTKHFLRGALYFNSVPNNDSLAPVIKFLKQEINHLIETIEWR